MREVDFFMEVLRVFLVNLISILSRRDFFRFLFLYGGILKAKDPSKVKAVDIR